MFDLRCGVALLIVFGVVAGGWSETQQPASPQQQRQPSDLQVTPLQRRDAPVPTITTNARIVLLDVVVTDGKGHPVTGLKQQDFTLTEDGEPQHLASFAEHHLPTPEQAAQATPKLPENTFTNNTSLMQSSSFTVFLLDALDTPIQAQMYVRDQMIAALKDLPPGSPVAIFQLGTSLKMIQGFTADKDVLLRAAESSKRDMPQNSVLLNGPYMRLRYQILTESMQGLGRYLAAFPGRKNMIWFTARAPYAFYNAGIGAPFSDTTSFLDDMSETTDVLTLNRVAVYPIDSRGLQSDPRFSAANDSGFGRGGRPGIGGPGGLGGFESRQFFQHGDLDDVAATTGGRAFYNSNGIKQAIEQVIETGSSYYTLAYSPSNKVWDGSYRKLEVKLAQQGLQLQYRKGYYARNDAARLNQHVAELKRRKSGQQALQQAQVPTEQIQQLQPAPDPRQQYAMQNAMQMGAVPPAQVIFYARVMHATPVKSADEHAPPPQSNDLKDKYHKEPYREYTILYSADPATVQLKPTTGGIHQGKLEYVTIVYDEKGQQVNSLISSVDLNLKDATYQTVMKEGLRIEQTIAVPAKGNFFLRMGVHDVPTNAVGATEVPVSEIHL